MCIYIYMYIYIYVYIYVYVYIYIYVCVRVCVCAYVYICMLYAGICAHACIYIRGMDLAMGHRQNIKDDHPKMVEFVTS